MSATDELRTVEDFDREIESLQAERDRRVNLLEDEDQREARRVRREQLIGRWFASVGIGLEADQVQAVCTISGGDAWIWDSDVLKADGWAKGPNGWKLGKGSDDS